MMEAVVDKDDGSNGAQVLGTTSNEQEMFDGSIHMILARRGDRQGFRLPCMTTNKPRDCKPIEQWLGATIHKGTNKKEAKIEPRAPPFEEQKRTGTRRKMMNEAIVPKEYHELQDAVKIVSRKENIGKGTHLVHE